MNTAPCYGCGKNPVALITEKDGIHIRGESLIVCTVCRFGICWECVALASHRNSDPPSRKPSDRPCCTRALAEGWDAKGVGVMASGLADERTRRRALVPA